MEHTKNDKKLFANTLPPRKIPFEHCHAARTYLFFKRTAMMKTPPRALETLPLAEFGLEVAPRAGEAGRQARLGGLPGATEGCDG